MAKDTTNSPGVLSYRNGDFTKSHEEAAKLLMDTHFPGNVTINTLELATMNEEDIIINDDTINGIVSYDKTKWAIKSFDPYKSPGADGIYPVLLQKAWCLINSHLMDVF